AADTGTKKEAGFPPPLKSIRSFGRLRSDADCRARVVVPVLDDRQRVTVRTRGIQLRVAVVRGERIGVDETEAHVVRATAQNRRGWGRVRKRRTSTDRGAGGEIVAGA